MTTPRRHSRGRSNQALQHFQTTPVSVLEDEIRSGERSSDLRTVFGPELADEMQQMVATPPRAGVLGVEKPLVMIRRDWLDLDQSAGAGTGKAASAQARRCGRCRCRLNRAGCCLGADAYDISVDATALAVLGRLRRARIPI